MNVIFSLAVWGSAIWVSYEMARTRGRNTSWAIIGGILWGWFAPLYYLIKGKTKEQIIKEHNNL